MIELTHAPIDVPSVLRGVESVAAGAVVLFLGAYQLTLPKAWAGSQLLGHTTWEYARTQPEVIWHYLRLCFWPVGQTADYDWKIQHNQWLIIPPAFVLISLFLLTLREIQRNTLWGVVGAWFFLILAPTSSLLSLSDLAFEHRMYLPSISVSIFVVGVIHRLLHTANRIFPNGRRATLYLPWILGTTATVALGCATYNRNTVWKNSFTLWQDVSRKVPHNPRGHDGMASELRQRGEHEAALHHAIQALELYGPNSAHGHFAMGLTLQAAERYQEAIPYFEAGLKLFPGHALANLGLAVCYEQRGKLKLALKHYLDSSRSNPRVPEAYFNLGGLWLRTGHLELAEEAFQRTIALNPKIGLAYSQLAQTQLKLGKPQDALSTLRTGMDTNPGDPNLLRLYQSVRAANLGGKLPRRPTPGPGNPAPAATQSLPGN